MIPIRHTALLGGATVGLVRVVALACARPSTYPAVFPRPLQGPDALGLVRSRRALEHGGEIVSFDAGFSRFPGVRCRLPAAALSGRDCRRFSLRPCGT